MPTHYEELSAPHTSVTHAAPLSLIGGDLLSATQHALLLEADEVVMVKGTYEQLRLLHARIGVVLEDAGVHVDENRECEVCIAEDSDDDEGPTAGIEWRDDQYVWSATGEPLSFDECDAAGLDGTLRSGNELGDA